MKHEGSRGSEPRGQSRMGRQTGRVRKVGTALYKYIGIVLSATSLLLFFLLSSQNQFSVSIPWPITAVLLPLLRAAATKAE